MLPFAVSQLTTFRWSLEQELECFFDHAVDGIGLWRPKLTDYDLDVAVEMISESGIQVSSLQWAGGFTGSEGLSHSESINDGMDAIRLAAELHARCLVVYTGGRGGHTRNHAWRLSSQAISEMLIYAEMVNVDLAIEPMHRGCGLEWTFLHDIYEALRFIDSIDHPNLKLVLDTYHVGMDPGLLEFIPSIVDKIALVQLGDACAPPQIEQDRALLGQGNVPLDEIMGCLIDSGYLGFLEVELMGQQLESFDYTELLTHSRRSVHDLLSLTGHSQHTR